MPSTKVLGEIEKGEYVERLEWTLHYYLEELIAEDKDKALEFTQWALGEVLNAIAPDNSKAPD